MIPQSVLDQVIDRCDIVEVISQFVPLKKAGRSFKGPCPFHTEKSPSFMVSPDKRVFHCFGCGVGGNVISFLMKYEKVDFREAVSKLADRAGILLEEEGAGVARMDEAQQALYGVCKAAADFFAAELNRQPPTSPVGLYVRRRDISESVLSKFLLGAAPDAWDRLIKTLQGKFTMAVLQGAGLVLEREGGGYYDRFRGRLMFPIADPKGKIVGFGGRVLDQSQPKYLNSPETAIYRKGSLLYGYAQAADAIRKSDSVMLVEGYMDVLRCHQSGLENVVAASGTALTPPQAKLICRLTRRVTVVFDGDAAGQSASIRGLDVLAEQDCEVKVARMIEGHDPDSYLKEFGAEKFVKEILGAAENLFDFKYRVVRGHYPQEDVDSRVRAAAEMIETLRKIPNPLQRAGWLEELGTRLRLPVKALEQEMLKPGELRAGAGVRKPEPEPKKAAAALEMGVEAAERLILGLALIDAGAADRLRAQGFEEGDWSRDESRTAFGAIVSVAAESSQEAAKILARFEGEESLSRWLARAVHDAQEVESIDKAFEDCLGRIRGARRRREENEILDKIRECERTYDAESLKKLLEAYQEIRAAGSPVRKISAVRTESGGES